MTVYQMTFTKNKLTAERSLSACLGRGQQFSVVLDISLCLSPRYPSLWMYALSMYMYVPWHTCGGQGTTLVLTFHTVWDRVSYCFNCRQGSKDYFSLRLPSPYTSAGIIGVCKQAWLLGPSWGVQHTMLYGKC